MSAPGERQHIQDILAYPDSLLLQLSYIRFCHAIPFVIARAKPEAISLFEIASSAKSYSPASSQ
jgi:hypothetical protein